VHLHGLQKGSQCGAIADHKTTADMNLHSKEPRLITHRHPYSLEEDNQMLTIHSSFLAVQIKANLVAKHERDHGVHRQLWQPRVFVAK